MIWRVPPPLYIPSWVMIKSHVGLMAPGHFLNECLTYQLSGIIMIVAFIWGQFQKKYISRASENRARRAEAEILKWMNEREKHFGLHTLRWSQSFTAVVLGDQRVKEVGVTFELWATVHNFCCVSVCEKDYNLSLSITCPISSSIYTSLCEFRVRYSPMCVLPLSITHAKIYSTEYFQYGTLLLEKSQWL